MFFPRDRFRCEGIDGRIEIVDQKSKRATILVPSEKRAIRTTIDKTTSGEFAVVLFQPFDELLKKVSEDPAMNMTRLGRRAIDGHQAPRSIGHFGKNEVTRGVASDLDRFGVAGDLRARGRVPDNAHLVASGAQTLDAVAPGNTIDAKDRVLPVKLGS